MKEFSEVDICFQTEKKHMSEHEKRNTKEDMSENINMLCIECI